MKVKLTTQDMQTKDTQWELNKPVSSAGGPLKLCTETCIHYYNDPLVAVFMNPTHANIKNPRMFRVETSKEFITDGLKYGSKTVTLLEELEVPQVTVTQRVAFGILCTLEVYKDKDFRQWAHKWLSGEDRSVSAARSVASAAACAARAADSTYAARSAAYAVSVASVASAACAARYAAHAAAHAAYAARSAAKVGKKINFTRLAKKAMEVK